MSMPCPPICLPANAFPCSLCSRSSCSWSCSTSPNTTTTTTTTRLRNQVYGRVQHLFSGQQDLLDDFSYFLPDDSRDPSQDKKRLGKKVQPPPQPTVRGRMLPAANSKQARYRGRDQDSIIKSSIAYPAGSDQEIVAIERIRSSVPRGHYSQVLKCMFLFSCDIVNKEELFVLLADVLTDPYSDLFDGLKKALGTSGGKLGGPFLGLSRG